MKRAVADTNIHISAIIFAGLPADFHELAFAGAFTLITSPVLLEELEDVLTRRFGKAPAEIDIILRKLHSNAEVVSTIDHLKVIEDDKRLVLERLVLALATEPKPSTHTAFTQFAMEL